MRSGGAPRAAPARATVRAASRSSTRSSGSRRYAIAPGSRGSGGRRAAARDDQAARNVSGDPNPERLLWSLNLPQPLTGIEDGTGRRRALLRRLRRLLLPARLQHPPGLRPDPASTRESASRPSGARSGAAATRCTTPGWSARWASSSSTTSPRVRELGVSTLVTTCPSCYYTWKVLYPRFGSLPADLTILHATQLLAELLDGRRIRPGTSAAGGDLPRPLRPRPQERRVRRPAPHARQPARRRVPRDGQHPRERAVLRRRRRRQDLQPRHHHRRRPAPGASRPSTSAPTPSSRPASSASGPWSARSS